MDDQTPTVATSRAPRPPRSTFLPYAPPWIGQEEIDEVVATLRSDWITTGPKTRAFEEQFGTYVQAPGQASLMVSSCTDALLIALAALGVGPGDEVIVPTLTFAATANVVEQLGATTVLVDVRPDTLCIDPDAVAAAVTDRTKVVVPVHYAGHPADLDALDVLADRHGFAILEDAAHSAPSWFRGAPIGSRANFAAFSFYPTKNLTTAEGGALTGDPELLACARVLSLHGMTKDAWKRFDKAGSWEYDIVAPGFKANMTDLQASLGMHQLAKLEGFHRRRGILARRYSDAFESSPALEAPTELSHVTSSWHLYVLRLRTEHLSIDRNRFIEELKARQIGTSVHYRPLHMMTYYRERYGYAADAFPVAHDAFTRMVSLPLYPRMSDDDQEDVIAAVLDLVDAHAVD